MTEALHDGFDMAAFGPPVLAAMLRARCEDFAVEELAAFDASGSGEHLLLSIEKRGLTTNDVAARIARWAGIAPMGVGYAGMKDRNAVARQRFSVHLPARKAPALEQLEGDGVSVLAADWHARKLPRGALAGNRFTVWLHAVAGGRATIEQRLHALRARGMPNAFGQQRFGRDGDNLAQVRALFAGQRRNMGRDKRSMLLSSARSALFNRVLHARIAAGAWEHGLDGEVWMLDGSHSVFGPQVLDDALRARADAQDIHPTGPMWGAGALRTQDAAAVLECAALADDDSAALRAGLEAAGLRQERRALRVPLGDLAWQWQQAEAAVAGVSGGGADGNNTTDAAAASPALCLHFSLPPGSYATALLAQLGPCADARGMGGTESGAALHHEAE